MKLIKVLIAVISIVFISGCGQKQTNPEVQKMYDEVMAVHDEVMPKMGHLNSLKRKVQATLDTISDDSVKKSRMDLVKRLDDADEGMMSWMGEFKLPKIEDQKIPYLQKEMVRIKEVKKNILDGIADAEGLLK